MKYTMEHFVNQGRTIGEARILVNLSKGMRCEVRVFDEWMPCTVAKVDKSGVVWVRVDGMDRDCTTSARSLRSVS